MKTSRGSPRTLLEPGAYGTTTLQVPKGTNGRAGHEAALSTLATNDCLALPATVESANVFRRK